MEEQIKAMRALGFTEDEIKQTLEDDKRIDKGERLFELTKEQKQNSKKARITTAADAYGKKRKIERKANSAKQEIISTIAVAIDADMVDIVNAEREIVFTKNGIKYKIVLSVPRN